MFKGKSKDKDKPAPLSADAGQPEPESPPSKGAAVAPVSLKEEIRLLEEHIRDDEAKLKDLKAKQAFQEYPKSVKGLDGRDWIVDNAEQEAALKGK